MEIAFLVSPTKLHKEWLSVGKDLCLNFLQSSHSQTMLSVKQLNVVKDKAEMEMVSSKTPKTQVTNNSSDLKFDVILHFRQLSRLLKILVFL